MDTTTEETKKPTEQITDPRTDRAQAESWLQTGEAILRLAKAKANLDAERPRTVEEAEQLTNAMKEYFHPSRVAAAALGASSDAFTHVAESMRTLVDKVERALTVNTGERSGPGTLTCRECEKTMTLAEETQVPPCAACHGTVFRRSY